MIASLSPRGYAHLLIVVLLSCSRTHIAALRTWSAQSETSETATTSIVSPLPRPHPQPDRRRLQEDDTPEAESVCAFFQTGRSDPTGCCAWGKYELCDMTDADKWIKRAGARCHDCVSSHNLCAHPAKLTIHMYLSYLDKANWKGNLVAIKAYLLTQNLLKTQLWLWTDSIDTVLNNDTRSFFHTFADVVTVKTFSWHEEIEHTPLAGHEYFSDYARLRSDFEDFLAGYGDLVRHVLLYNYGGLWMDTDVVLLRDVYPVTMQIGYQFMMRWVNNHIYFMKARSPLGKRILEKVAELPFEDTEEFEAKVINGTCRPAGYFPVTSANFRDFYNFCIFRLILADEENISGTDPDNILFDQPLAISDFYTDFTSLGLWTAHTSQLNIVNTCTKSIEGLYKSQSCRFALGWWDQHWLGCPNLDTVQNETEYMDSISKQMALHTRYPGHGNHTGPQDSQLQRTLQLIDNVFDQCQTRDCVQHQSVPLVDYLYYDDFHTHQHRNRMHAHDVNLSNAHHL